jgi:hypothetical protein
MLAGLRTFMLRAVKFMHGKVSLCPQVEVFNQSDSWRLNLHQEWNFSSAKLHFGRKVSLEVKLPVSWRRFRWNCF